MDLVDWEKFFEGGSIYDQIYKMEIVEELMEAWDETIDNKKRVSFVSIQKKQRA